MLAAPSVYFVHVDDRQLLIRGRLSQWVGTEAGFGIIMLDAVRCIRLGLLHDKGEERREFKTPVSRCLLIRLRLL